MQRMETAPAMPLSATSRLINTADWAVDKQPPHRYLNNLCLPLVQSLTSDPVWPNTGLRFFFQTAATSIIRCRSHQSTSIWHQEMSQWFFGLKSVRWPPYRQDAAEWGNKERISESRQTKSRQAATTHKKTDGELLRAGRAPQRLVTGLVMSMSASCSVIVGHDRRLSRPFTLLVPEMATTTAEKRKKNPASFLPSATGD